MTHINLLEARPQGRRAWDAPLLKLEAEHEVWRLPVDGEGGGREKEREWEGEEEVGSRHLLEPVLSAFGWQMHPLPEGAGAEEARQSSY
jgi:hypothetical protein